MLCISVPNGILVTGNAFPTRMGADIGKDRFTDTQSAWIQNIPLLTIPIIEQGDASVSIRIILDGRYLSVDSNLISMKIDLPIQFYAHHHDVY
jgi:hypothetical protein